MGDEGLETAGVDGEPVHHVAAEAGAGGGHTILVDVRQLFEIIDAVH